MRAAGITPVFVGHEINFERLVDANHDHPRNYTAARAMTDGYSRACDMDAAMREARRRLAQWGGVPTPDEPEPGCTCAGPGRCPALGGWPMDRASWQRCRTDAAYRDTLRQRLGCA